MTAMVDSEFCNQCGFLMQDTAHQQCQTCLDLGKEMQSLQKRLHICSCEYCLAVSFKLPIDAPEVNCYNNNDVQYRTTDDWSSNSVQLDDWADSNSDWSTVHNENSGNNIDLYSTSKESAVSEEIRETWLREQNRLKKKMILEDSREIRKLKQYIQSGQYGNIQFYIGGMDISFIKGDDVNACAALVILSFPDMKVVYEDYQMIELTAPYIPGFLAFREAGFLIDLHEKLVATQPQFKPTVIFLDGNGTLHPRGFGIACQVGVLLKTPCLGVAKHLIHIDGLVNDDEFKASKLSLQKGGDTIPLKNTNKETLGMALRSLDSTTNPIYVSCGHLMCLETAVILVKACCQFRIPEPVRKADLNSREFLRSAGKTGN